MITEDYCSFEISKLLKEKGFDGWCDYFYDDPRREELRTKDGEDKYWNGHLWDDEYAAPTHQMAMKWLREVHGIHICPSFVCILNGSGDVKSYKWEDSVLKLPQGYIEHPTTGIHDYYDTYEEAVEAALKYSLENLI